MVRSHWGRHYRSFKRGAKHVRNTASAIRNFVGGLDFNPLPDTLSEEQGSVKVRSAKASAREQHRSDLDMAREMLQVERDRAIRKMYRMATSDDGADIRGTKFDPLGKSAVGRVTLKNAARELERLSEFNNSNSVWYYSDRKGNPISARDVRRYRDAVRRYNADIDEYEKSVAGTHLQSLGDVSVGDWIRDFRPKKAYLAGGSHYSLERMNPDKRTINFESAEAMREKTNKILYDITNKGKQKKLTNAKKQIAAMIDIIGDPELYDVLTDIPDDVLWLLWTVNPDFANNLSLQYEAAKEGYFDKRRAGYDLYYEDVEDSNSEIKSLLKEIHSIQIKPEDDFSDSPINKRKSRRGRR